MEYIHGAPGWLSGLCLTLGFGSGHNLMLHEFKPHVGLCAASVEPALDSHSLSLSLPLPHSHGLPLSRTKYINFKTINGWGGGAGGGRERLGSSV